MPLATCSLPCGSWLLPRSRDSYDGDGDDDDFELQKRIERRRGEKRRDGCDGVGMC